MIRIRKMVSHYAIDGVIQDGSTEILPDPRLPVGAKRFWKKCAFNDSCSGGVVATVNGIVVGFARYTVENKIFYFQGTWVDAAYRRQGLSQKMWNRVLRKLAPGTKLIGIPISQGGVRMLNSLSREFPELKIDSPPGNLRKFG